MSNEPSRILCVFGSLDRGGAETMCMNLYRHIDRSKIQFDFIKHTEEKCAYEDEIRALGGSIFAAPRFKGTNLIQYQNWWKKHLTLHPEHHIIHGHYFTISKFYFSVCKRMRKVTIGHSHTDTYKNPAAILLFHGVESLCDYRLACSEKAGKLLYPHKDFVVLKNAIDVREYIYDPSVAEEVRKEFALGDTFVLGAVGTIKEVKNPLGMVEILKAVVRERPNTKLLWVGSDGGMRGQVVEKLKEYALQDNVIFTGVRSDVNRLLQAMDVFLMPSFSEGIPVSLIEAQAAGLRCFVSESVSREVDITGRCAFLPLGDYAQWAREIMEAELNHEDTYEQIVMAGYDICSTAAWLQDFYLSIQK